MVNSGLLVLELPPSLKLLNVMRKRINLKDTVVTAVYLNGHERILSYLLNIEQPLWYAKKVLEHLSEAAELKKFIVLVSQPTEFYAAVAGASFAKLSMTCSLVEDALKETDMSGCRVLKFDLSDQKVLGVKIQGFDTVDEYESKQ